MHHYNYDYHSVIERLKYSVHLYLLVVCEHVNSHMSGILSEFKVT